MVHLKCSSIKWTFVKLWKRNQASGHGLLCYTDVCWTKDSISWIEL